MSEALVRKCPHCSKPYIKLDGCNKMTCSACGKLSCFVCRKAIANYDHFDGHGPGARRPTGTRCPLYDANEARTEAERIRLARDEAQRRAIAEATNSGVQVDEADLAVEAPEIPAAVANPRGIVAGHHYYQAVAGLGQRLQVLNRIIGDANGAMGARGGRGAGAHDVFGGFGADIPPPPGWGARPAADLQAAHELRRQLLNRYPELDARPGNGPRAGAEARARAVVMPHRAAPPPAPVFPPPAPPLVDIRGGVRAGDFAARLEAWRQDVRQNDPAAAGYPPLPPPRHP